MKKTYLAQCLAVLALGMTAVSCSKSYYAEQILTEEQAFENAEKQLGITIDPNQTWLMTQQVKASITINEDYGETYNVKVFSNDPLEESVGCVVAEGTIENGETFNATFSCPSALNNLMVGVTNSQGYTYYRNVVIENGTMSSTFGEATTSHAPRRSQTSPSVPDITIPDAAYVNKYLDGAKEPTAENTTDNYDNSYNVAATDAHWEESEGKIITYPQLPGFGFTVDPSWGSFNDKPDDEAFWKNTIVPLKTTYDNIDTNFSWDYSQNHPQEYVDAYNSKIDAYYAIVNALGTSRSSWLNVWTQPIYGVYQPASRTWVEATPAYRVEDPTFVRKFVIKNGNTWNDYINVLSTEGLTDGVANGNERTVVVQGTWNLEKDQKVGSRGQIIVANGGQLVIDEDCTVTLANQARLVVMPGGQVLGAGNILVTNGNEDGFENYNGGTIHISGTFNNNFGKFYNYNYFECNTYAAGGQGSSFFNHGVAHINNGGETNNYVSTNARIYNACQWYCENDMRAYILELTQGSYFYVGGQLQMSASNDGSNDPSYVAMAAGALLDANDLYNNLTSWIGPEEGWAVCEFDHISYLNWNPGTPTDAGYFINNIAVSIEDKTYLNHDNNTPTYTHFKNAVANGYGTDSQGAYGTTARGNGKTVLVSKGGANLKLDASSDFEASEKGCTPGYNGTPKTTETTYPVYSYAFEDTNGGDYDMNDVVLRVQEVVVDNVHKIKLTLVAVGAALDLNIRLYPAPSTRSESELAHYQGTPTLLTINNQQEAHLMLNARQGVMTNTGDGARCPSQYTLIDKGNYDPAHLPLSIIPVGKDERYEMRLASGLSPFGIIVPGNWKWPVEYVAITTAYNSTDTSKGNQSFAKFGEEVGSAKEWYNYPSSATLVMDESSLGF